jgi:hypothetical protein
LARFARGESIAARPPGVLHYVRLLTRRHRAAVLGVAGAVLLSALAMGVGLVLLERARQREVLARTVADHRLNEIVCLSDATRLAELTEEAESRLWPATPDRAPAMTSWLERARELVSRLAVHRAGLESLRAGGEGLDPTERRWREALARSLVAGIEKLGDSKGPNTIAEVERRLDRASSLVERSVTAHEAAWAEATGFVGDRERAPSMVGWS